MRDHRLQLWVGTTTSRKRLDRFLSEDYSGDSPISEFASSQGVTSYDHDFLESHRTRRPTADPRVLLAGVSFASSFIDAASPAIARLMPANTVIALSAELLDAPRSASGVGLDLHYVGTFAYDPNVREPVDPAPQPPPAVSLRLLSGGPVTLEGRVVRSVKIGHAGLLIGRGSVVADRPYLDLERASGAHALAQNQVSIYRDRFDQWIIEDLGFNGLTSIDGVALTGERTFPWHGSRLSCNGPAQRHVAAPPPNNALQRTRFARR